MESTVTALVIGDPHFKISNVLDTDRMVEAILRTAANKTPDMIVVLGDVLDRHETIHVSPLTRATNFLRRLIEISPTYVLIGNHDLKNNRQFLSDEHPFSSLKSWGDRMTIVDTTTQVMIKNQQFTFVPYVPAGRFVEALNHVQGWTRSTAIFAHQEFKGCQLGSMISVNGDRWDLNYPYVISGHIHDYHELQPNLLYTGTPIQHSFGDRQDKTISWFQFESPNSRSHTRIDLGLPKKRIVRLNCSEVSTYIPRTNSDLKIIIRGTSAELKSIMKHPNIKEWKQHGYRIMYKDQPTPGLADVLVPTTTSPLKFSTVFYDAVKQDPPLRKAYTRMFGNIRVTTLFINK